jgi:hypothetical protein
MNADQIQYDHQARYKVQGSRHGRKEAKSLSSHTLYLAPCTLYLVPVFVNLEFACGGIWRDTPGKGELDFR